MATKHNTVLALDFDEAEILGPDVNVVWKTVVNVMSRSQRLFQNLSRNSSGEVIKDCVS